MWHLHFAGDEPGCILHAAGQLGNGSTDTWSDATGETILLVEDEHSLRTLTTRILKAHGTSDQLLTTITHLLNNQQTTTDVPRT